jgi:VanZ family protein
LKKLLQIALSWSTGWTIVFYFWLVALWVLSFIPLPVKDRQEDDLTIIRLDYLEHFFLFLLIPVFYFLASRAKMEKITPIISIHFLAGVLFVSVTELQQLFIVSRAFNPVDLFLNIAGYFSGIFLMKYLFSRNS